WTKLSCWRFKDNTARRRRLALPRSIRSWNLTTLREKLVKIAAQVVSHAKYIIFQLADVAVRTAAARQCGTGGREERCGGGGEGFTFGRLPPAPPGPRAPWGAGPGRPPPHGPRSA